MLNIQPYVKYLIVRLSIYVDSLFLCNFFEIVCYIIETLVSLIFGTIDSNGNRYTVYRDLSSNKSNTCIKQNKKNNFSWRDEQFDNIKFTK